MDAYAEVSSIIRQYGSAYLHHGNLSMALEYYAQAAATVGGGETSWTGRGPRGAGEEGELTRFLTDSKARQQFLLEAARKCQEAGLDEKSIEIQKRVGAFSMALDTINKCLSEAICALSRGGLDGESRRAGLINSGNEILETFKYYPNERLEVLETLILKAISEAPEASTSCFQERDHVLEQETVLRQLEAILSVHKMARAGHYLDALRELAKLPFLPLGPRVPDVIVDALQNLSPHVQACVPDLLKVALTCLDNVTDSDGSLRAMRAKILMLLCKCYFACDLFEIAYKRNGSFEGYSFVGRVAIDRGIAREIKERKKSEREKCQDKLYRFFLQGFHPFLTQNLALSRRLHHHHHQCLLTRRIVIVARCIFVMVLEESGTKMPAISSSSGRNAGGHQEEKPPKAMTTKICIAIRSFEDLVPGNTISGLPADVRKIRLPESRVLYTVLRSPHVDKKSREQFEMRMKKQLLVAKVQSHELRNKYFWLKRQRIFGAQYEIQFHCKTRMDKDKLQKLLP
ncbi:hypothetical protein SADUNF_Sadunf15G0023200 [Salix dunnii]|uniref:Nuclear pore protein n=2 Tax=Salix TaxID=40685 RepID=A0A835JFJ9_9ROSI|nr:hypothetical protein SADUNF_Sadunf15G0023200 [Salix dunnii]